MMSSLCLLSLLLSSPELVSPLSEVYRWPGGRVQVAWPNNTWAELYGSLAVTVIGIKVWADNIYLTAPRWHGNVVCLSQSEEKIRNINVKVTAILSMLESCHGSAPELHCPSPHPSGENISQSKYKC